MKKVFVLDTNVVLFDALSPLKFKDHDVVICITVLEEIDKFKRDMSDVGRNARQFSRFLDSLRKKGNLSKGVVLSKEGGRLIVDVAEKERKRLSEIAPIGDLADNIILEMTRRLTKQEKHKKVIFLSKDTNLRVRADILGVHAEDYELTKVDIEELYSGVMEQTVSQKTIEKFFQERQIETAHKFEAHPNQFVLLREKGNESNLALTRYEKNKNALIPLKKRAEGIWGIFPKNLEQSLALDLLLDDSVKLVTLVGKAGTGKTILALAAGLLKTIDEGRYHRLLVSRPIFPMGKDIGYLPGDIEEKLNPWMQPIFDNVEYLLGNPSASSRAKTYKTNRSSELINQGLLNIEPLTYIRGRSIANQYMIVDEAQNLTPHEIKTIITRAGENTKVILTGDCYQIDNPFVDAASNGLTYVVERFKGEAIAGHITLVKGERSVLAELATNLL